MRTHKEDAQRDLILAAAFDSFRQLGIRPVTMDEIARGLRISKKTIYRHFADKEAIVAACTGEMQKRVLPAVRRALEGRGPVTARLLAAWQAFSQVPRLLSARYMGDLKADYPHIWADIDRRRHAVVAGFEQLFVEGVATGELRPEINPRVATRILFAILDGVMVPDVLARGEFTPFEAMQTIVTLFNRGLFAGAPHPAVSRDGTPAAPTRERRAQPARRRRRR